MNFLVESTPLSFCADNAGYKLFGLAGVLINIIKILVPIILVVMGSIDLTKAVVAQKDDEIKKGYQTLLKRLIYGVAIFFVPAIVDVALNLTGVYNDPENDASCGPVVEKCVFGGFSGASDCLAKDLFSSSSSTNSNNYSSSLTIDNNSNYSECNSANSVMLYDRCLGNTRSIAGDE